MFLIQIVLKVNNNKTVQYSSSERPTLISGCEPYHLQRKWNSPTTFREQDIEKICGPIMYYLILRHRKCGISGNMRLRYLCQTFDKELSEETVPLFTNFIKCQRTKWHEHAMQKVTQKGYRLHTKKKNKQLLLNVHIIATTQVQTFKNCILACSVIPMIASEF